MAHLKRPHVTLHAEAVRNAAKLAAQVKHFTQSSNYRTVDGVVEAAYPNQTFDVKVPGRAHAYPRLQCIVIGAEINVGDGVIVAYNENSPDMAMIVAIKFTGKHRSSAIVIEIGLWTQSAAETCRNALGNYVNADRLSLNPTLVYIDERPLPTTNAAGVYENAMVPYGLALAFYDGQGIMATAWPVKRDGVSQLDYAAGAWDWSTGDPVWQADFTAGATSPPSYNLANTSRFFYDQYSAWINFLPETGAAPKIYSARSTEMKAVTTLGKPCTSAAISGPWLLLPYHDNGCYSSGKATGYYDLHAVVFNRTGTWRTLRFYKQNQETGAFVSRTEVDPLEVLQVGVASRRVCLPSGGATGPSLANNDGPPWHQNGFVVFVSGRAGLDQSLVQDQCRAYNYVASETSYGPGSGTGPTDPVFSEHANVGRTIGFTLANIRPQGGYNWRHTREFPALTNPRTLFGVSYKDWAIANYSPTNGTSSSWIDATLGDGTTHGAYAIGSEDQIATGGFHVLDGTLLLPDLSLWENVAPLLLPLGQANLARIASLAQALEFPAGPGAAGGLVVDSYQTVNAARLGYFCALVPQQVVYGGRETENNFGGGARYDGIPDQIGTVAVYFDSGVGYNISGIGAVANPAAPLRRNYFLHRQGALPLTMLYVFDPDSGEILYETDISQRFNGVVYEDQYYSENPSAPSLSQDEVEIWDNVWQILAFPPKECVAVLRDLHADGLSGNPSPHIEIYSTNGTPQILATVPIGTQDLLTGIVTGAHPGGGDAQVGDRAWNPYYAKAPAMKAAMRLDEFGEDQPHIIAACWEYKKVNTSVSSEFKRVVYSVINLSNPSSPVVTEHVITSADLGVGGGSQEPGEAGPLHGDWDSLIMAGGRLTWLRDSKFRFTDSL